MATNHEFDAESEPLNFGNFLQSKKKTDEPIEPFMDRINKTNSTHIILVMPGVHEPQIFYGDSIVLIQGTTPNRQYECKIDIGFKLDKSKTKYNHNNGIHEFVFYP